MSVYVIGLAMHPAKEREDSLRLEEMAYHTSRAALDSAGVSRRQLDSVTLGACDELDGRPISSMLMTAPAGGYDTDEIKVTDSGASALCLAYARFIAGESQLGLVASWCKASKTDVQAVMRLRGDPFYTRPLGIDGTVSDAMFAQAVAREFGLDEAELTDSMQALADRGEAFNLMLRTERQRHVEVDGRAAGGMIMLKVRDVAGQRLELAGLGEQHRKLDTEVASLRALLDAQTKAGDRRDAKGRASVETRWARRPAYGCPSVSFGSGVVLVPSVGSLGDGVGSGLLVGSGSGPVTVARSAVICSSNQLLTSASDARERRRPRSATTTTWKATEAARQPVHAAVTAMARLLGSACDQLGSTTTWAESAAAVQPSQACVHATAELSSRAWRARDA